MKLYHATFESYLPGIRDQGLVPDAKKNWADCAAGFVYLSNDMSGAVSFCEAAEDVPSDVSDSGICCFEVDTKVLDRSCLATDPNILWEPDEDPWCFVYAGRIPYNALRLCWTEELGEIHPALSDQIQSASLRTPATHIPPISPERSL